ncbi:MAG: ribosome biogenesis GTPase YqeH [Solobacterium sp.]|jgi:ribosome biogenesis GTPase YqeH|nr:ribosome biogenesis GTPase YqeH [Solobacterium sp.]MCH4223203.1 ribosome biogenesis GTPase YqeH [Solobacterium sp.]MCH4266071.1 ribosome biogenesis GTPase YqeH [Solobacterium sp.]
MAVCKGCGVTLQSTDPNAIGYTPKEGSEYCQRCFRLMHYDDLTVSMRTGIDPDQIIEQIAKMDALIIYVVDLFDFEAGMIPGLARKLPDKDILMVCAKRDILPDTLNHEKVARFVFARLKELNIKVKGLVLTSKLHSEGIDDVKEAIRMLGHGRPVVVMGRANSGKSTLLNNLFGQNILTSSRFPGTTLEMNQIVVDGITYIDTPGIEIENSLLMDVNESDLKTILPYKTIKPQIFQLHGDQSFAVAGLARLDLMECDHAACVWYLSDKLQVHRSKVQAADELWRKHYGELFSPVPLEENFRVSTIRKNLSKMDIVIDGLGWASVSGQISTISVRAPKSVNVTFRKAML